MYKCLCVENARTSVCLPVHLSGFLSFSLSKTQSKQWRTHAVDHIDGKDTTVHNYLCTAVCGTLVHSTTLNPILIPNLYLTTNSNPKLVEGHE